MSHLNQVLGLKSFEKLLYQKGFVICQQTGQKITQEEDLVAVHLTIGESECVIVPVHKDYANSFLQKMMKTFSAGPPLIEENEPLEYLWRE